MFWAPNGLKELPQMRISLQPYWQIDYGIIKRPIMACTQILLHKLGVQNKDFGAVSQTDLTRS